MPAGRPALALLRQAMHSEPSPRSKRVAWWPLAGVAVVVSVGMLWLSIGWQEELRELMNVDPESRSARVGVVPGGHGHIFGPNVVEGWLALGTPDGWTDEQTVQLRKLLDDQHG